MKLPRISEAFGNIPEELVGEAVTYQRKSRKKAFIKWGAVAACFAVAVTVTAVLLPMLDGGYSVTIGEIERDYRRTVSDGESDIDFPWEYKLIYEKFSTVQYGGQEYRSRRRAVREDLLGESLGTCTAIGVDDYCNENPITYTETFDVRKIKGISEEKLVAVGMDGEYYVYFNNNAKRPAIFGELLDAYGLSDTLPLTEFSVEEGYKEKGCYRITDDAYIWQILAECRDAEAYAQNDSWNRGDRNYLSFTATSEALGVYKRVFYITEDGYISTNIFDYKYVYYIGEERAESIIAYAKANATEAEQEPYEYTLAGTVTEIGEGYILLDDTVLCRNKNDGMVFKILTEDLQIRRYLACTDIQVGDTVAVKFQSKIVLGEDNAVSGALSVRKGHVIDGDMAVPE